MSAVGSHTARAAARLRALAREPLVLFAVAGAALFAFDTGRQADPQVIEVPAEVVELLELQIAVNDGTPPTGEQVADAVNSFIEEEILLRYALDLGLDRGDPLIRRRLVQKARFLLEDQMPVTPPDEQTLNAFLLAHADQYREPERLSFEHIYLPDAAAGPQGEGCAALFEQLAEGRDPAALGSPFGLGRVHTWRTRADLARRFGERFTQSVWSLPVGDWSGPHLSRFGCHLVRPTGRRASVLPALAEIRERVEGDWLQAERERQNAVLVRRLRERFDVRVAGVRLAEWRR